MRRAAALVLTALLSLVVAGPAHGQEVRVKPLGRFAEPVYVTGVPGASGTLAVVERYGEIRLLRSGRRPSVLADLRSRVRVDDPRETVDQRGLFSVAFAPDYRRSGRFYVFYVDRESRLRVDALRRGRRAVRPVLDLGLVSTQHHGGQLQFGPDGRLYVSTGMDEEAGISQDPMRLGGKILRLDPRAAQPVPEVYALGLRNPWRFSFDRRSGAMLIGDVGGDHAEEINVIPGGAGPGTNFGWPAFEGLLHRPEAGQVAATAPALALEHTAGWCAVTGGYVVRDRALPLAGRYVFGDLCRGTVFSARLRGTALVDVRRERVTVPYLVSFGEDGRGRLYGVSFGGDIWRFVRG